MIIEEQKDVLKALNNPSFYETSYKNIDVIQSHISLVFLVGDKAYKLKRGVKFPYLDYSTIEKRKQACFKEIAVTKEGAPTLFLGVSAIVKDSQKGIIMLPPNEEPADGQDILDYVVVMNRFEQENLFENLAPLGKLDRFEMMDLAETVVKIHSVTESFPDRGGSEMIKGRIIENDEMLRCFAPAVFDITDIDTLRDLSVKEFNKIKDLLDERKKQGKVKRCHGDIHLHNICMIDGKPILFDAIEFNDDLALIDVMYDLAFLLMDMEKRGLRRLASIFFNHYMAYSGDYEGILCLPLFQSCRAAVRAQVCATMASMQTDEDEKNYLNKQAFEYLVLANQMLNPKPPILVASGGLSGSGKSRLSREIAPYIGASPGAMIFRTDVIRKKLKGKLPHEHLTKVDYDEESSKKTYENLRIECTKVIRAGLPALADGIFASQDERIAIEKLAKDLNVPFHGFWMYANRDIQADRVATRQRNPSDATVKVLDRQFEKDVGEVTWNKIDTSGAKEQTVMTVRKILDV
ncbi:MAG: AAA family ATPase [Alphaproteobacteria bacterium]